MIAPGGYNLVGGRVAAGVIVGLVTWLAVVGIFVWVPRFLQVVDPTMPVQPVVAVLALALAVAWLESVISSWKRR